MELLTRRITQRKGKGKGKGDEHKHRGSPEERSERVTFDMKTKTRAPKHLSENTHHTRFRKMIVAYVTPRQSNMRFR